MREKRNDHFIGADYSLISLPLTFLFLCKQVYELDWKSYKTIQDQAAEAFIVNVQSVQTANSPVRFQSMLKTVWKKLDRSKSGLKSVLVYNAY